MTPRSVTKRLRDALDQRDGHLCAWHAGGCGTETLVPHHRVNRGMGGRPSLNRLSNLVWLCSLVNGLIEADAEWATVARDRGIKLSAHAEPSEIQIDHAVHGLVFLLDDGTTSMEGRAG